MLGFLILWDEALNCWVFSDEGNACLESLKSPENKLNWVTQESPFGFTFVPTCSSDITETYFPPGLRRLHLDFSEFEGKCINLI